MTYHNNFFVYRPLLPESEDVLRSLQKEYGSIQSFSRIDRLHLTLLSSHTESRLRTHKLQKIMSNAPEVSIQPSENEIVRIKIDHRARDMTQFAIKLMLNKTSGQYTEEHKTFKNAVLKVDPTMAIHNFTQPHVTIGHFNARFGSATSSDIANELLGTTLRFGPTTSNVGNARFIDTTSYIDPHLPTNIDVQVRTIQPGSIPEGLLASLRSRQQDA